MTKRCAYHASWAALLLCGLAPACIGGTDAGPPAGDAGPADGSADGSIDAGLQGVAPMFASSTLAAPEGAFFDFPFPSALRTDADGHPVLDGFPTSGNLLPQGLDVVEGERAGFSPLGAVYFRFTGALDPASLPAPDEVTADDSPIWVIDIDPASPEHGDRFPAYVRFHPDASVYWPGNELTVRPVPGVALRPGTRYAVVVRDGLLDTASNPVVPNPAFEAVKEPAAAGPMASHYDALFTTLEGLGVPRASILMATDFTTSDPAAEMDALRTYLHDQVTPSDPSWGTPEPHAGYVIYPGTFQTVEFFSGTDPYNQAFGEGAFRFDASGQPMDANTKPVAFAITVPTTGQASYPLVLYGHGTGGSERSHTYAGREGPSVAGVGAAMLGFEAALHGSRSSLTGESDIESLIFVNPVAAREMVRQTVADMMLLYRMLGDGMFDVPASVTGGMQDTAFDPTPEMYMGHSQGAQEAGMLLGVEPTIEAAFLSEGGGGAVIPLFDRIFPDDDPNGTPIICLIGVAINVLDCSQLTEDHPAIWVVQSLLDPADPLNFARRMVRERPATAPPLSIAMTEGTADPYTSARSIEALAATIPLPIVEPVVQETLPYQLLGIPSVASPAADDLSLPGGRSGGVTQWDGAGHFVIYDSAYPTAHDSYVHFFETALAGSPEIAH